MMLRMNRLPRALFLATAVAFAAQSTASAEIRRVPQAFPTIDSAIRASYDGDVVEVDPGTYSESVNFGGRNIVVRSSGGAAMTLIRPSTGRCFSAIGQEGNDARLEGFTLSGGVADRGGGVFVSDSSPTFVNCVIVGNSASQEGGGVYVSGGSPRFIGCSVSGNTAAVFGGGLSVQSGSIVLEGCQVNDNRLNGPAAGRGAGIFVSGSLPTVSIVGGAIRGNVGGGLGAGICGGTLQISFCNIDSNELTQTPPVGGGGGIALSAVTIVGGSISQNRSPREGGALYAVTGRVTDCVLEGNTASLDGGAVWSNGSFVLTGCTLELNQSGGFGGAWFSAGGSASLELCDVRRNAATVVGGIWVQAGSVGVSGSEFCGNGANVRGNWTDGGGNAFLGSCDSGSPTIRGVPIPYSTISAAIEASFDGDIVEVEAGTYSEGINLGGREIVVRSRGGAAVTTIDPPSGRCLTMIGQKGNGARIEGFTLSGGSADRGGGVFISSSSPVLVDCAIVGNSAASGGAGLYLQSGNPRLERCRIAQNATPSFGAGAYVASGSIAFVDCEIEDNELTTIYNYLGGGAGVFLGSPRASATLLGGSIRGNYGGRGAGIRGGTLVVVDCAIDSNYSSFGGGGGIADAVVDIDGGSVSSNFATGSGGGLLDVTGTVSGTLIVGNEAGDGGGAFVSGSIELSACTIDFNKAVSGGGGVYSTGPARLLNCVLRSNQAALGGAIRSTGALAAQDCTLSANRAIGSGGGAISGRALLLRGRIEGNSAPSGFGGAWRVSDGASSLTDSQVRNNEAQVHDGIRVDSGSIGIGTTFFCGQGVNVSGAWTDNGGNQFGTQCPPQCPGDASGDGLVNGEDIGLTISRWGPCTGAPCFSDFDGDGFVSGADLGEVLSHWGACRPG